MPEGQLQRAWPEPPPRPSVPRSTRIWTVFNTLHRSGWLRPRRIGCLLLILLLLALAALWAVSSAVNSATAVFRDPPPPAVTGNPLAPPAPPAATTSGSDVVDRIVRRGKVIVAVRAMPGLAEREPGTSRYTGFDVALLDLIATDLGADPAATDFILATGVEGQISRGEVDFGIGGYELTPQRQATVGIAGPYLDSPLRLAVPADSNVSGLDGLGDGRVCVASSSSAKDVLADRLGGRLMTRSTLEACANLLGRSVAALAGDERALRAVGGDKIRLVGAPLSTTEYGIGVAPGDPVLLERVNAVLRRAVADGTWARLYQQYLGTPVPEPPAALR